jgi:hypothetical protein
MRSAHLLFLALGAGAAAVASVLACSVVQNQQIGIDAPPYSDESFGPVGDYLNSRCGTLDCHGQTGRNLRIYGCQGLRLDPEASPASCIEPTTEAEYQATYRSLVALEPQVMTAVYPGCAAEADGGWTYPPGSECHPELLTFIRKARGTEAHKGGQLICVEPPCPVGTPAQVPLDGDAGPLVDLQDVCLVTWLEGATDTSACVTSLDYPTFPTIDAGATE